MYIRVTTLGYDPAQEEKVFQIIDDELTPQLRKLSGFVSYTGGIDRDSERALSITVWDDMEHAAGFRTALGGLVQKIEAAGVSFDPSRLYEITRQVASA